MAQGKSKSWKMERASVTVEGKDRPRSNKYSKSDNAERPAPGTRQRVWIGGYEKTDGTKVSGHYRNLTESI